MLNGNWTKNTHNIRFGTDIYFQDLDHNQPEFSGGFGAASGEFRFRGQTTERAGGEGRNDFNSWASFMLGLPREAGKIWQFNENGYFTRTKFYSAFLRDRWQINPKLTMSYGVRAEIFPFPGRKTRGLERYDFANNQMLVCGVGGNERDCGITQGRYKFVPRVGFAYRATQNTVVRAGYGITNDPFNWARPLRTNWPIMAKDGPQSPHSRYFATTFRDGLEVINEPQLAGSIDIPGTTAVRTFDETNAVRGYIQSWNLTLEHRIGSWIGSAGYVATRSVNQLAGLEQNWSPIGGENAGRVLYQKFGRVASTNLFGSLGTAKYDSLQTKLERRFSNGYQMNFAYTWSHALGYTNEDSGAGTRNFDLPEFYHRMYGNLGQDLRHNFQFTGIYELPFGEGKRFGNSGPLKWILGGWQFNHLFSAYSGSPFSVTADDGDLNAPPSNQVADCIGAPRRLDTRSDQQLYDPSSFAQPTGARFGTCGLNILNGPALYNLDIGIFRKFQITERVDMQFARRGLQHGQHAALRTARQHERQFGKLHDSQPRSQHRPRGHSISGSSASVSASGSNPGSHQPQQGPRPPGTRPFRLAACCAAPPGPDHVGPPRRPRIVSGAVSCHVPSGLKTRGSVRRTPARGDLGGLTSSSSKVRRR